jgi:hypothetical protein
MILQMLVLLSYPKFQLGFFIIKKIIWSIELELGIQYTLHNKGK